MASALDRLLAKVGALRNRLNELARLEAEAALVQGPAATGILSEEKERNIEKAERLLDEAQSALDASRS